MKTTNTPQPQYHNPENVPDSAVPKGWRFLLVDEEIKVGSINWNLWHRLKDCFFSGESGPWNRSSDSTIAKWTYITKSPLPAKYRTPVKPKQPKTEVLKPVDLRTCKPGDKLICRSGIMAAYVGRLSCSIYPHSITYSKGGFGSRTDDGKVFQFRNMHKDLDIIRIIPMSVTPDKPKSARRKNLFVPDCHHRKSWLVANAHIEWCYCCGAIRQMKQVEGTDNSCTPAGKWALPVGRDGENPFNDKF